MCFAKSLFFPSHSRTASCVCSLPAGKSYSSNCFKTTARVTVSVVVVVVVVAIDDITHHASRIVVLVVLVLVVVVVAHAPLATSPSRARLALASSFTVVHALAVCRSVGLVCTNTVLTSPLIQRYFTFSHDSSTTKYVYIIPLKPIGVMTYISVSTKGD